MFINVIKKFLIIQGTGMLLFIFGYYYLEFENIVDAFLMLVINTIIDFDDIRSNLRYWELHFYSWGL